MTSFDHSVKGRETGSGAELLPWVQEATTQTQSNSKNVSVQFRTKSTSKGKFLSLGFVFKIDTVLQKKRLFTKVLVMISSGIQITVPTKSQGTQCTLLKEMFVTSTPCGSDDEPSDCEEMDAEDDPLYVPDPDDERDEDEDFADFDDCLYE